MGIILLIYIWETLNILHPSDSEQALVIYENNKWSFNETRTQAFGNSGKFYVNILSQMDMYLQISF